MIARYIDDLGRELNDQASVAASTTRAVRLYRTAGVTLDVFLAELQAARRITQARTASIRRRDGERRKNKMPYMLAVLADRLGLRKPAAGEPPDASPPPGEGGRDAAGSDAHGDTRDGEQGDNAARDNAPRHPEPSADNPERAAFFAALAPYGVTTMGQFITRYRFGVVGGYDRTLRRALAWERQHGHC